MNTDRIDQSLATLFKNGRRLNYTRGEVIIRAGDTPSGVYLVSSGWIKVYALCNDGEPNIITTVTAGDVFPIIWALGGPAQDVTFAALNNTVVYRLSRGQFAQALQTQPELLRSAAATLLRHTTVLYDELENLHYRTARQRVAFRLLIIARDFGKQLHNEQVIDLKIPSEYIARSTNMTRETASRELSNLARKKLIRYEGNRLVLIDSEGLKRETGISETVLHERFTHKPLQAV